MRRVTIKGTLNEYDVADEFFVIDEQGIKMYVFTVLGDTDRGEDEKTTLVTPVEAVVENLCTYNEGFIGMLKAQSERTVDRILDAAKQQYTPDGVDYV